MSNFYGRQWEVKIDDEIYIPRINLRPKLEDRRQGLEMKMTFTVLKDFGGYISYADIALFNLSSEGANQVIKKDKLISLIAGYEDNLGLIFEGNIKNVLFERNGADTITRILALTGKSNEVQSIQKAFGKNAKVVDIIRSLVTALKYEIEIEEADFAKEPLYTGGKFLGGDPRVYLDEMAKTHSFSYVFDGKKVVVVKNGSKIKGAAVVVSQTTGMEGVPEITEVGVDVVTRLNPSIKIGGQVNIESKLKSFNFSNLYFQNVEPLQGTGIYNVFKIRHTGDTYGDVWSTKITGFEE